MRKLFLERLVLRVDELNEQFTGKQAVDCLTIALNTARLRTTEPIPNVGEFRGDYADLALAKLTDGSLMNISESLICTMSAIKTVQNLNVQ